VNTRQTRAVFVLATFCGLRVSEIIGLRLRDVKAGIGRPVIRIPGAIAKRHKPREIPLWRLSKALHYLSEWKREREGQGAMPADPFVCAQSKAAAGNALTRQNARNRFKAAVKVLGAERADMLSIHNGRHTCASHLLAAGWPLPLVRDTLGHADVSTTSVYSHVVVDDTAPPDPFAFVGGDPPTAMGRVRPLS